MDRRMGRASASLAWRWAFAIGVAAFTTVATAWADAPPSEPGHPAPPAGAAPVRNRELSTSLTCAEFMTIMRSGDRTSLGIAILWLDGVYAGRSGESGFPAGWARTLGEGIGGTCAITVNAGRPVLEIIAEIRRKYDQSVPTK